MEVRLLNQLIDQGYSSYQIAIVLGVSQPKVKYWLDKHGLKTHHKKFGRQVTLLNTYQGKYVDIECTRHGTQQHVWEGTRGRYRCKACNRDSVNRRRTRKKQELVDLKGGRCERCGYDRSLSALSFHHREPSNKKFSLSEMLLKGRALVLEELEKCDLLCMNCHHELEESLRATP